MAQFPFLLELGYWLLIYWVWNVSAGIKALTVQIYQGLRAASAKAIRGNKPIFDTAERHGLQILALENLVHLDIELGVQQFILDRAPWLMAILARVYYSHIVLGVAFYVYCYTFFARPQYRRIRRTMALENVLAFAIISLWRCMPPRLLPEEYGFIDVLHSNTGGSAWTQNKFQLIIAAMPSLHFGNSVLIAFCLVSFSPHRFLRTMAPVWPAMMGLTIVATANHYILDAVVGTCVITVAYQYNHVMLYLLPLERSLLKLVGVEKPMDAWLGS